MPVCVFYDVRDSFILNQTIIDNLVAVACAFTACYFPYGTLVIKYCFDTL